MKVTIWQVCSRHIQHRIVPPDPHWGPGPGCVDYVHHHTTMALCDRPTPRATSKAITGLYIEHQGL